MIIRSRAPLRIGLAGGGTDLESYSNVFGGCALNTAIQMYAYCTIIPTNDNKIKRKLVHAALSFSVSNTRKNNTTNVSASTNHAAI